MCFLANGDQVITWVVELKILLTVYTLFQILVWWVTISDWPLVLVCISFYSPHGSWGNVPEYSFGRISWNLPWHTLVRRFILLLANLQNKFEWGRYDVNNLSLHLNWCCWLLHKCPLGHNPIFPHPSHILNSEAYNK